MICFNHPDRAAVGICKTCSRGLCVDCAADLGHGLACKGVHEAEVETLSALIERSRRLASVGSWSRYTSAVFMAFIGTIFVGTAIVQRDGLESFMALMGIGFVLYAIWLFLVNRKAKV